MPARITDTILAKFSIDAEGLRNLHAILKERCREISDEAVIEYVVERRDSLNYTTQNVEDICQERNGSETRITSIRVKASKDEDGFNCTLSLDLNEAMKVEARSEDRAKLLLLASDVRNLASERFKVRGLQAKISYRAILTACASVTLLIMFGFLLFGPPATTGSKSAYDAYVTKREAVETANNRDADRLIQSGEAALRGGTKEQTEFLARQKVSELEGDQKLRRLGDYPEYGTESDVKPIFFYLFLGSPAIAGAVYLLARIIVPRPSSVFLIGDEIARQRRNQMVREKLIWGVGATIVLGVISSVIAAVLFQ